MFPGQGTQYRGMGKNLFEKYKNKVETASNILGYDLEELCLKDPKRQLNKTQFTQPALFVVNALGYHDQYSSNNAHYFIGHSLGEYNALLAAGAFDFETGVKIVQKRGLLMSEAPEGAMAAVLGLDIIMLKEKLNQEKYNTIDIANFNTPSQIVLSGPKEAINQLVKDFDQENIKIIPLLVTSAFHSRYMENAVKEFRQFLSSFHFNTLKTPVISNVTAQNYAQNQMEDLLSKQISSNVQWVDSIRFLMGQGVQEYIEIGGELLTKMVQQIQKDCTPIYQEVKPEKEISSKIEKLDKPVGIDKKRSKLGSTSFCERYKVDYAYIAGGLHMGIASIDMVKKMANAKMLSFLGTKGRNISEINRDIEILQQQLVPGTSFGVNVYHNINDSHEELQLIKHLLQNNIKIIEAGGFSQITLALAYFRITGLERKNDQRIISKTHIIAKVARPELAEDFMKPISRNLITKLIDNDLITQDQAEIAEGLPLSEDICVEIDPGGVTQRGSLFALFPSIKNLRNRIQTKYNYTEPIHLGISGGIGTPEAAVSAFIMGADFILTGSVNQCTVESNLSTPAKEMLQTINVQDTTYVPDEALFEVGVQVQVLKKGVLFATRAKKLYELYQRYESLDAIPDHIKRQLEDRYFKKPLEVVWQDIKEDYIQREKIAQLKNIEERPKKKMLLIFKYFLKQANRYALEGNLDEQTNFQIQTGAALGAFNEWVKGTSLEVWGNRHVDEIGIKIMETAEVLMKEQFSKLISN